jgi:hypothetical protein
MMYVLRASATRLFELVYSFYFIGGQVYAA